jgi:hypothetical protein
MCIRIGQPGLFIDNSKSDLENLGVILSPFLCGHGLKPESEGFIDVFVLIAVEAVH